MQPRARLLERIRPDEPLVILHSSSGMGKTVALAQLARRAADNGDRVVWIHVSPGDGTRSRFWTRVVDALHEADALEAGSRLDAIREAGFADRTVFDLIPGELAALPGHVVLALDDFHEVTDDAVRDDLVRALASGSRLCVYLTSSADEPLGARVHPTVQQRNLDADALNFDAGETASLVSLLNPDLDAPTADALSALIFAETGGWPLATHVLAAGATALQRDAKAAHSAFVTAYVTELLDGSSAEERDFLLSIALLESCSPALAGIVSGCDPRVAAERLDRFRLAATYEWHASSRTYHYRMHSLVREELRERALRRFGADAVRAKLAATLDILQETDPRLALRTAREIDDLARLEELLTLHITEYFDDADAGRFLGLDRLPWQSLDDFPALQTLSLLSLYARPQGNVERALGGLERIVDGRVRERIHDPGPTGVAVATLRMAAARIIGRARMAEQLADGVATAVDRLTEDERDRYTQLVQVSLSQAAVTHLFAGGHDDAERLLEDLRRRGPKAGRSSYPHAVALLAFSKAWRGQMRLVPALLTECEALTLPLHWRDSARGAGYRIASALRDLESGEPASALDQLDALAAHEPTIELWPYLAIVAALAIEARFGAGEALDQLDASVARHRNGFPILPSLQSRIDALRARLAWQIGVPPGRRGQEAGMRGQLSDAYLSASRGDWDAAARHALVAANQARAMPRARAECLILHSEALVHVGLDADAHAAFVLADALMRRHALTLPARAVPVSALERLRATSAPPGGWWIQSGWGADGVAVPPAPLTAAEIRTLRMIDRAGTIEKAAAALYVSPDTVKSHLKSIHRKLVVGNRRDALRRARQLGYL